MIITPKISNDAATAGNQTDPAILSGSHARRNSESKSSTTTNAADPAVPHASEPQNNVTDAAASNVADSSHEITDTQAADAFMSSFSTGMLAQPGVTMLAQANLSPGSVYDLLQ
jgi:flagellin-like hook-associated protein FlgL